MKNYRPPELAVLLERCRLWNAAHREGCHVFYHPVIGEPGSMEYQTRGEAFVLSGHTAVVFLIGKAGCVALDALTDTPTGRRA
jgi:hypothetical protein